MKKVFVFLMCVLSSMGLQAEVETAPIQEKAAEATRDLEEFSTWSKARFPFTFLQIQEIVYGPKDLSTDTSSAIVLEDAAYVRLKDGSFWQVSDNHAKKLAKWEPDHLVVVHRNSFTWFASQFYYVIHNVNRNEKVEAHLRVLGEKSAKAMQVFAGCTTKKYLKLKNGTYWAALTEKEYQRIRKLWKKGDCVAIAPTTLKLLIYANTVTLLNLTREDMCTAQWLRY